MTNRATGWVAPKDQYAAPVMFNPYTGEPRDVRDVQSDPQGILIVPPGKVEMLAAASTPPAQAADSVLEDAARYRWIRRPQIHAGQGSLQVIMDDRVNGKMDRVIFLDALDASIDAARKQGGA